MKICKKCKIEKDDNCFSKNQPWCKDCQREYNQQYYAVNKSYVKTRNAKYYEENKKAIVEQQKEYQSGIVDELEKYRKQYRQDHKSDNNEYQKIYRKSRYEDDVNFRLRIIFSSSIYRSLKFIGSSKDNNSILEFLPYTIEELKDHLEKQFEPWMNWGNYSRYNVNTWDDKNQMTWTWNIDHIIPQSYLPYVSMEDNNFRKCWSLENLRPLSAKQNIKDGNRRQF